MGNNMKKVIITLLIIFSITGVGLSIVRSKFKSELEQQKSDVLAIANVGMPSTDADTALQELGTLFSDKVISELDFDSAQSSTNVTYFGYKILMVRLEHVDDKVSRIVMEKLEYR